MTNPEAQGGKTEDRQVLADRFNMLRNPDKHGLSQAQSAVLSERYDEEVWQDAEAEQFFEGVLQQLDDHPGEFVASLVRRDHGISFNSLLPENEKPLSFSGNQVGAVTFRPRDETDISSRIPMWNHFPFGFESFDPLGEHTQNLPYITYHIPDLNLSNIRKNTSRGQYKPIESSIVIGNDAIAESMLTLSRRHAIGVQCAFMLLSEALDVEVPIVGDLEPEMDEIHKHWQQRTDLLQESLSMSCGHMAKLKTFAHRLEADRMEFAEKVGGLPVHSNSSAFPLRDTRTWPYTEIGDHEQIGAMSRGIESLLASEIKELETAQLPYARLFLASAERYLNKIK